MSSLYGTNVSATIKPFTTADNFPTHEAQYGKGGYRTVNSESDLTSISLERLEEGMLVYIKSTGKIYKYIGDTNTNNSNDWEEFTVSAENEYYKVVDNDTERLGLQDVLPGTLCYELDTNKLYKYTSGGSWVEIESTPPPSNDYYKVVATTTAMESWITATQGCLCYVTSNDTIYKRTNSSWVTLGQIIEMFDFRAGNPTNSTNTNSPITITHNLNKHPYITIMDGSNEIIIAKIEYPSENTVRITFSGTLTNLYGYIYIN